MRVNFRVILHSEQRYPTVGDWFFDPTNTVLEIHVSSMGDWRYEFLVMQHEFHEATLCLDRGISEEDVSCFDKKFELERGRNNYSEPGDDPRAPYRKEHFFATTLERLLAAELGVNWNEYDEKVCSL